MMQHAQLWGRFDTVRIQYRRATQFDYNNLGHVMYDAVRNGDSLYNQAQRQAWAPKPRQGSAWNERLSEQFIAVADSEQTIVGMMSLSQKGYLDLAYIRPAYQGSGIFRKLFAMLIEFAKEKRIFSISVHASLMAQPAFSAMGFDIVKKEIVTLGNQDFDRFEMQLMLAQTV